MYEVAHLVFGEEACECNVVLNTHFAHSALEGGEEGAGAGECEVDLTSLIPDSNNPTPGLPGTLDPTPRPPPQKGRGRRGREWFFRYKELECAKHFQYHFGWGKAADVDKVFSQTWFGLPWLVGGIGKEGQINSGGNDSDLLCNERIFFYINRFCCFIRC